MYTYRCTINRVVDGDTIDITIDLGFNIMIKERVRLEGVDTPEVYGSRACPEGKVASQFVKDWVADQTEGDGYFVFESKKYDPRDKYGRCLGIIRYMPVEGESVNLNEVLIEKGWEYTK